MSDKINENRNIHLGEEIMDIIAETIAKIDPFRNHDYDWKGDIGTSRLFADVFKNRILYNTTANEWFVYDGIRWKKDEGGLRVDAWAKEFVKAWLKYADRLQGKIQEDEIEDEETKTEKKRLKAYKDSILSLASRGKRESFIKDARSYVPVVPQDFDKYPSLLNCKNGVLDLETGKLRPHDPALMLSKVANVSYDPHARCDEFNKFLREIMRNNGEKIRYLQALFGYALSGTNEREEGYILYGSTTRNGKSTLLDTITFLFGDYGMTIQPQSLAEQKRDGRSASGDVARLDGCRLLQMSEPPKSMKLDVALFKTLTGRDKIVARHLREREFEFTPVFKLFINTNYLPVVMDDTLFSSGRIKVITFDRHFRPEEQDVGLKDRLKTPETLSGILNWILQGYLRYRQDETVLNPPLAVVQATEAYRGHSDKVGMFLQDQEAGMYACKELYERYTDWCKGNGYGVEGKQSFMEELQKRPGFKAHATLDGKTVRNVFCVETQNE